MADLEVFISNPGHHVATLAPVVEYVAARGFSTRVHSFCELRGFESPWKAFAPAGAEVLPAWPSWLRRPGGGPGSGNGRGSHGGGSPSLGAGPRRRILRDLAWKWVLAPRLKRSLNSSSRLAVLPNDSAFPYDRVATLLRRRAIPFVLVQEGIRFPLPAERVAGYGLGGARALAVWGEGSAQHFRSIGIDTARIHATGSPRFDHRPASPVRIGGRQRPGPVAVLLITNPIDIQGFCEPAEKTSLVARLVSQLRDVLSEGRATLTLRPHPGESTEAYAGALAPADRTLVSFDAESDLETALEASDLALVMASTVGLEALHDGIPLAVLPTPGHGHVHDYVERDAALAVVLGDNLGSQLIRHSKPTEAYAASVEAYLHHHLACSGHATRAVGELMIGLLDDE